MLKYIPCHLYSQKLKLFIGIDCYCKVNTSITSNSVNIYSKYTFATIVICFQELNAQNVYQVSLEISYDSINTLIHLL